MHATAPHTVTKGVDLRKIDRLAALAFRNALRLHFDSIILFNNKSYPSAFFLSILALEELGKVFILDDFLWHSKVNGRFNDIQDEELRKEFGSDLEAAFLKRIFQHHHKQQKFAYVTDGPLPSTKFFEQLCKGDFEIVKQNAVYAGLARKKGGIDLKSRIKNPLKIDHPKAQRQITLLNDTFQWIVLSNIKQAYFELDTDSVNRLMTRALLRKLKSKWRNVGRKTATLLRKLKGL